MKLKDKLFIAIVPWLGAKLIRFVAFTQRSEVCGEDTVQEFWQHGKHVILCAWHDQLLMMVTIYQGPGAKILISRSRDGELIARTVSYFGQGSVRGSSSRGGREAFREMLKFAELPVDLAVTPDGPKGPRRQIKDGVLQLARISGRPVVPLNYVCSRGHRFRSWDRFLLPSPFARSVYCYGSPQFFSRDQPLDECRQRLQQAMDENQQRAETHLETYGVSAV
ncbi:lysophospholipid acyltransferase family protein [Pelovirga terrestris]|uniref:Lysophospholipid acyltransferase family protein n=1 Tax=Pelovirga terrestris TaxID=2771352 RepID=A0A8J6URB9_9BACT|nr:lysophospholipid acyltransferase family protein [Pelovirga terrestris]MBD1401011.1 lysophospholipid acyltransferase family protein [Pelovirga terrestris]